MVKNGRNRGPVAGRNPDGTFAKGNAGRPPGTRTRATRAAEALLDGEAEALTRKAVELALAGDTTALRLCLERIAPPRRDAPISVTLPELNTSSDALAAINAIVQAVAIGELTPGEAGRLVGLVEAFRKTAEVEDLERRILELESAK